jgi:uncharacterized membrane protein YkoI
MKTTINSKKLLNKKMLVLVIAGAGILLSGAFIRSSFENTWAQQQQQTGINDTNIPRFDMMPAINGSINIREGIKNFFEQNAKISFVTAAQTAQKQIANGTILGGHIGITQGYLTYTYLIVDPTKDTTYKVIIDAGNGKVLYTSKGLQMGSFGQPMFGPFGHWKGHGEFGDGRLWHNG